MVDELNENNQFVLKKDGLGNNVYRYEIRGYNKDNEIIKGIWEVGKKGTEILQKLGEKYFIVPAEDGKLSFVNEAEIAKSIVNKELSWELKGGSYVLTESGSNKAVSLPSYILERDIAYDEGKLYLADGKLYWKKDAITYNTFDREKVIEVTLPGNAEQVIGWINKPNLEHGFLKMPITQAILEQLVTRDGWNGDHLSAMQAQDESGQYMWFKDKNNNGIFDKGEQADWKIYPAAKDLLLKQYPQYFQQAENDLFEGWSPVYSIGIKSDFTQVEFNAAGREELRAIYENNLVVVDTEGNTSYNS